MSARKIQADYEKLTAISSLFKRRVEQTRNLTAALTKITQGLSEGGWIGEGGVRYQKEMGDLVFPALKRLQAVLEEGANATQKIAQAFQEAEEDAGRLFKGEGIGMLGRLPSAANLTGDSFTTETKDAVGGLFTWNTQATLTSRIPNVVNTITASTAGNALITSITNAGMKFTLPGGTVLGDVNASNAKSWTVNFADLDSASGTTYFGSRTISISTSRFTMPGNTTMFARTLIHEMQHAYDSNQGRTQVPVINSYAIPNAGALTQLQTKIQAQVQAAVNTEIRAHTREYALRDGIAYDETNAFNTANTKYILKDRGYGSVYEAQHNEKFKQAYKQNPANGLYKVKVRAGVGGAVDIQITKVK